MNPFDNLANSTLLSLGGIFNFNSPTQTNQAGVSAKASGAKEEENKLPFKSSPAPNPLHFFNESQAKEKITNPRNSRFLYKKTSLQKLMVLKRYPRNPFLQMLSKHHHQLQIYQLNITKNHTQRCLINLETKVIERHPQQIL